MPDTGLRIDVGDGVDLVLREAWTVPDLHAQIVANLDRLRPWEPWSHGEQTEESLAVYTRLQLQAFVDGKALPLAIRADDALVGTVGAQLDAYSGTATLGYWIGQSHEGKGIVTRSCARVIDELFGRRDVHRLEIRTATHNERSRKLAERLGFTHEGTLREAFHVGDEYHDLAVYGLLAAEHTG